MKPQKIDETHFQKGASLDSHYNRHVSSDWEGYWSDTTDEYIEPMSKDEYDENADKLSKQKVRTSKFDTNDRYIGFFTNNGRILKFDKLLNEVVVYKCTENDSATITYYKVSFEHPKYRYKKLFNKWYGRELTDADDEFNK